MEKLVSVVLLAEKQNKNDINSTIRDILSQTYKNIEILVSYIKNDFVEELKKEWIGKNIFWIEAGEGLDLIQKPSGRASGEYVFYKTINPVYWLPRHIESHITEMEFLKASSKWSYSFLELKASDIQEPLNNIGWRIDFPKPEELLLDEICHTTNIKPDWNLCVENNQFVIGKILPFFSNYHTVHPKEISMRYFINTQPTKQQGFGGPANDNVSEEVVDNNGELTIVKKLPTILGNIDFSIRNKQILALVENNDLITKIAVKRTMGMGDVILIEPVIRALKSKYKNAKIDVYTSNYSGSHVAASLFEGINNLQIFDIEKGNPLGVDFLGSKDEYHLKFDLDLAYESRPGKRYVDAYLEACGFEEQITEKNGELVVGYEFDDEFLTPKLKYEQGPLIINKKYVAVELAGSGWGGKEVAIEKWLPLIHKLKAEGYAIAYLSSQKPAELVEHDFINDNNDYNKLLNYLKYCEFYIGCDNGPMHIATAFNKKCFIFNGAALSEKTTASKKVYGFKLPNLDCLGCKHKIFFEKTENNGITFVPNCKNTEQYKCSKDMTAELIISEFEKFLIL
jgi:ADP-heptose:LPS heptosyltransferase